MIMRYNQVTVSERDRERYSQVTVSDCIQSCDGRRCTKQMTVNIKKTRVWKFKTCENIPKKVTLLTTFLKVNESKIELQQ